MIGEHEALCIDEALDARIEDAKYWGKISKVHHIRQEEESEMMKELKEEKEKVQKLQAEMEELRVALVADKKPAADGAAPPAAGDAESWEYKPDYGKGGKGKGEGKGKGYTTGRFYNRDSEGRPMGNVPGSVTYTGCNICGSNTALVCHQLSFRLSNAHADQWAKRAQTGEM